MNPARLPLKSGLVCRPTSADRPLQAARCSADRSADCALHENNTFRALLEDLPTEEINVRTCREDRNGIFGLSATVKVGQKGMDFQFLVETPPFAVCHSRPRSFAVVRTPSKFARERELAFAVIFENTTQNCSNSRSRRGRNSSFPVASPGP